MNFLTPSKLRFATLFLTLSVLLPAGVYAQAERDMARFFKSSKSDASKLTEAYMAPLIDGLSYGFNSGWAQTAKAHKTLGFDLMINVNAVFIPSSANYFEPGKLGLESFSSVPERAPTVVGPADQTRYTSEVYVDNNNDGQPDDVDGNGTPDVQTVEFDGPEGFDLKQYAKISSVAIPTVTLGVGVYKNTDVKIRWVPELGPEDSKVKLFGIGVMHDIKQHIPGIKLLPFDLSVMGAYTNFKGHSIISEPRMRPDGVNEKDQRINYNMNAWLFQAMISKKFSVITLYGALGYNTIKTSADVKGSYRISDENVTPELIITDPISVNFKNSGFRATAGFRLKLAVLCISADYTLQEYNSLSLGIGFAVR